MLWLYGFPLIPRIQAFTVQGCLGFRPFDRPGAFWVKGSEGQNGPEDLEGVFLILYVRVYTGLFGV